MTTTDLYALSQARGGPIRIADAAETLGVSTRAIRDIVRRHEWRRDHPGVATPNGTPRDAHHLALAACAAVGPHATVTRFTASHLYGLRGTAPSRVQLVVPAPFHPRRRGPIEVARSRLITPGDVTVRDHLPIARPEWLAIDLAANLDVLALRALLIDLRVRHGVDLLALAHRLELLGPFTGRGELREALRQVLEVGRVDSPWELEVREAFAAAGIHLDRGQVPFPCPDGIIRHFDLGLAALFFGVEINGFGAHSSRADLERDAARANAVARLNDDWRVVHLTWLRWQRDRAGCIRDAREVVSAQSIRHLGIPWPTAEHLGR